MVVSESENWWIDHPGRTQCTVVKRTRRDFLERLAAGSAALLASRSAPLSAWQTAPTSPWSSRIGLEVYTVRDLMASDFEGRIAKVVAIGYSEIEPTS